MSNSQTLNNLIDLIDDIKHKITDNEYLKIMNSIKDINIFMSNKILIKYVEVMLSDTSDDEN